MKNPKLISAHIVKVYLDICLVLVPVFLCFLLVWTLVSPLVMSADSVFTDATIPVTVGESSVFPVLSLATRGTEVEGITNLNLVRARGELRFDTTSWGLHLTTILPLLIGGLLVMWVIFLVRQVVASVLLGDAFTLKNAARLRLVGLIMLVGGTIGPLLEYVHAGMVLARIGTHAIPISPPLTFPAEVILLGLLMLALSTVFGHGKELEDEKSLTI